MAEWNLEPEWTPQEQINGGEEFSSDNGVSADEFNKIVENMQYIYRNGGNFMLDPYPKKSFFITTDTVSPASLYGGTWEKIEGRFLFGANSKYTLGSVGGSEDAVLVEHKHAIAVRNYTSPGDENDGGGAIGLISSNTLWYNSINTVGESGVGKNMPPYLAVNIWHRIA